jgi:hypothetical protein
VTFDLTPTPHPRHAWCRNTVIIIKKSSKEKLRTLRAYGSPVWWPLQVAAGGVCQPLHQVTVWYLEGARPLLQQRLYVLQAQQQQKRGTGLEC